MLRTLFRSVSALVVILAGIWVAPRGLGQVFVGTPAPEQFSRQGQPSTQNGEWPGNMVFAARSAREEGMAFAAEAMA